MVGFVPLIYIIYSYSVRPTYIAIAHQNNTAAGPEALAHFPGHLLGVPHAPINGLLTELLQHQ